MAAPAGRLDPDRVSDLVLSRRPDALVEYLALIPGSLDDHECRNLRVLAENLREHLLRAEARRSGSAQSYEISRIAKQARKIAARSRMSGNAMTDTLMSGSEVSPISDTKGMKALSGFVLNEETSSYSDGKLVLSAAGEYLGEHQTIDVGVASSMHLHTKHLHDAEERKATEMRENIQIKARNIRWDELNKEEKQARKLLKAEGMQIRRHENRIPNLKKTETESNEACLRAHLRDGNGILWLFEKTASTTVTLFG